jgi:hypothetical protein
VLMLAMRWANCEMGQITSEVIGSKFCGLARDCVSND